MTRDEDFARAVWNVANREGLDITKQNSAFPRGFWNRVVQELGNATNAAGNPWTENSVSQQWRRQKDKLIKLMDPTHNIVQVGQTSLDENRVREIFREELDAVQSIFDVLDERLKVFQENQGREAMTGIEEPPLAPKSGRKSQGMVRHISVRVDKALYDEFVKTCQEEWKVDQGRGLDIILWNFLGKPDLSFQKQGKKQKNVKL